MKRNLLLSAVLGASVTLTGCATKQFAQAGDVTDFERTTLSCREIDVEMAKTQGIQHTINKQAEFSGLDVLAFLGDWGIGNAIAEHKAQVGAAQRMSDLNTMRAAKNCPIATTAAAGGAL
ncbi:MULTISPECIES: hypothetical protein [unclassified Caballeronia]|uniref:hypothetical protein n=1 Tax=unclassified Caballeronia TaxID=2646786 RepID=UPI0028570AED|nr:MULTISPECIES: hypothetical protein [unclassified Caballeronia]MDR5772106.1 hypothetical protein [Caballeronia sp. LZ002]MDR5847540.1 hypothetical protein [Caballeronia sp. LZ003]